MTHARKLYGEILSCLSDLKEVGLNGCPAPIGNLIIDSSTGFHELDDLLLELKLKTEEITLRFLGHEKTVASMLKGLYDTTTSHILNLKEENRKLREKKTSARGRCDCHAVLRMDCFAILYEYRSFLWKWSKMALDAAQIMMQSNLQKTLPAAETEDSEPEDKKVKFPGKRRIPKVVALLYVLLTEFKVFDRIKRSDFISLCMAIVKGDNRTVGGYVNVLYPDSTENKEKYPTWDYVEPARRLLKKLRII